MDELALTPAGALEWGLVPVWLKALNAVTQFRLGAYFAKKKR